LRCPSRSLDLPGEERAYELGAVHLKAGGNVREDGVQCAYAEGLVLGDGDVVLGACEGGCEAEVAPGLAGDCAAIPREERGLFATGDSSGATPT
jgi:hypothetical protein